MPGKYLEKLEKSQGLYRGLESCHPAFRVHKAFYVSLQILEYDASDEKQHCLSMLNMQDPNKESEAKIKADYDELYEEMSIAFRNLED